MVYEDDINKLVRIKPINRNQHWMRGRLIGLERRGETAIVFIMSHKKTEKIPARRVKVWNGKQHIWEQQV